MDREKPFRPLALAVLVVAAAAGAAVAAGGSTPAEPTSGERTGAGAGEAAAVPGELLVRFEDEVSAAEIDRINARLGAEVVNRMSGGRLVHVRIPAGRSLESVADTYAATPGVRHVERNLVYRVQEPTPGGGPSAGQ